MRVLGNLVGADGFDYVTSEDVLAEFNAEVGDVTAASYVASGNAAKANGSDAPADEIDTPLYSVDGLVRRATALRLTPTARRDSGEGGD